MDELSDTQPEAEAVLLMLLRQTPAWRKLQLMQQLNDMARTLVLSDLRQQYPNADSSELYRLLAERLYGSDVASKLPDGFIRDITYAV